MVPLRALNHGMERLGGEPKTVKYSERTAGKRGRPRLRLRTQVLSHGAGSYVVVRSRRPRGRQDLIRRSGMTERGCPPPPRHPVTVLSKQQTLSRLT